jgi:hypothetical protein
VRLRTVGEDGRHGEWSNSNPEWMVASECGDNNYLDISIFTSSPTDPSTWTCQPCPEGANCDGPITWKNVAATFGYWRVPGKPPNKFIKCAFPGACLGAPNPKLEGRYYNESLNIENNEYNIDVDYAAQRLPEGCNDYFGFEIGSRLCHKCLDGFKRLGRDRCSLCPQKEQNVGLLALAVILLLSGGVIVVWMVSNV